VNGRLPSLLVILAMVVALPQRAIAQGTETDVAAQFFEAGASAAKRGDFKVCAEAFTEAHKRAPHGATIYNAGLCWENAKDLARAANDYKEALRLGNLNPTQESQAKKRFAELKEKLGEVEVAEPDGATGSIGPITQRKIPFTTFMMPGQYEVRVEGPDGELVTKKVDVEPGKHAVVKLELTSADPDEPKTGGSRPVGSNNLPNGEPDEPTNYQATAGWIVLGASVVVGAIAGGFYLSALSAKDDYEKLDSTKQEEPEGEELRDKAYSRVKTARILGIGAGIGAVAGVTLVLTAPKKKSSAQARAAVRLHPFGASASLSF